MSAFFISTLLIFAAELGDKSQLVALWFATRYRWWLVIAGVSGLVGGAALDRFAHRSDWDVIGVSRRKPWIPLGHAQHLSHGYQTMCWISDDHDVTRRTQSSNWHDHSIEKSASR